MYKWVDVRKVFPGLKGTHLHVINAVPQSLKSVLLNLDFTIYVIDGAKICDESTFFNEVAEVFDFPAYFGHNWDAWDECLGDFSQSIPASRTAIIWERADQTFEADAQTFLQAVCDLDRLAARVAYTPMKNPEKGIEPKQVEVFLLGQGNGFKLLSPG